MDADHGLFSPYSFSATSGNLSVRAVGSVAVRKKRTGGSLAVGRVALSLAVNNATSRAISRLPYTIASRAQRGAARSRLRGAAWAQRQAFRSRRGLLRALTRPYTDKDGAARHAPSYHCEPRAARRGNLLLRREDDAETREALDARALILTGETWSRVGQPRKRCLSERDEE